MARHRESTLAAIKTAVDIVSLVGDYLPLQRAGAKYKALCPFHDDHNPSLELNPDRQSYKCWSCGAGGDIFDFVMEYERVEFPEALRMLAERAGVTLEMPAEAKAANAGPSKSELLEVHAWAEDQFAQALSQSQESLEYLTSRGLTPESLEKFRLGFSPDTRDWLYIRGRRQGFSAKVLEAAGLVTASEGSRDHRDRFRGRLIFPIHDFRGRPIGFGGRVLPAVERRMSAAGKGVAKYLNSPETPLFLKRKQLYAVDLARVGAREQGWVAVVEGYTDVIAAHQVGLTNVVGTLGTALGDDHVQMLRRLADRVVLVFDGDEAGQKAADRSLPIFLGHEVEVRVLTLPPGEDPCDFLLSQGREAFLELVERASDAFDFALTRAMAEHDPSDLEGARRVADAVLTVLSQVPVDSVRVNNQLKVKLAIDRLAVRLRLPAKDLMLALQKMRQRSRKFGNRSQNHVQLPKTPEPEFEGRHKPETSTGSEHVAVTPLRPADFDRLDRELIEVVLNEPSTIREVITRVETSSLRDQPLRAILQACYDLYAEGESVSFDRVVLRLADASLRSLAAGLLLPIESGPLPERLRPPSWQDRLANLIPRLAERSRMDRIRELEGALAEVDPAAAPDEYRELWHERLRLLNQRPVSKNSFAS